MTTIKDMEMAIASLSAEEYVQFRRWFFDHDWEKWDRQIEADAESGKLDFLRQEAAEEKVTLTAR